MVVNETDMGKNYLPLVQQQNSNLPLTNPQDITFADSLKEFIHDVNGFQKESDDLNDKMIKGEPVDLHDVMIAAEKAKTTFSLLMELRNKFTNVYQEAMRIQD